MKRVLLLGAFALFIVATGCKEKELKQIELLTKENEALRLESKAKDSTINEFFLVLNEIESNLALIKEKENLISKNATAGAELKKNTREQINEDIQTINELMVKNRKSIRYLNQKLKESNLRIEEFEKMIASATQEIQVRDAEIAELKEKLTQLNFSIDKLNAAVDTLTVEKKNLTQTVNQQTETMNTAWYAFGTKKELEEKKVIEKTGGFLGIGKSHKLKADFDKNYFTKVDITKVLEIPLFAKKASIITSHPTDAYKVITNPEGVSEKLEILDATSFWSASKYLVIIVE